MTRSFAIPSLEDRTRVIPFAPGSYEQVLCRQHEFVRERHLDQTPDVILLGQHERVVTLGRGKRERPAGIPIPVVAVERGGQDTWHGPGQLVGYPIVSLKELGISVREYLRLLEQSLIGALAQFGLEAGRREGATGVWIQANKVASIGVAVRHWITYHGFALNVNPDLRDFQWIQPCGFGSNVMTSMAKLLGHPVDFEAVTLAVLRQLVRRLELAPPVWEPCL